MRLKAIGFLAGMVLAFGASQASAELVTVTYQGVVWADAERSGGYFGDGRVLTGDAFTAIYTFDPSAATIGGQGRRTTTKYSDSLSNATGVATLEINGRTLVLDGTLGVDIGNTEMYSSGYVGAQLTNGIYNLYNDLAMYTEVVPSIEHDASYSTTYRVQNGEFYYSGQYPLEQMDLHTVSVSISVSAVPLPGSFPLFGTALLGSAGLGYARRRGWMRRRMPPTGRKP